ncbi:hypothetical protein FACS1894177_06430 [Bacteroidia bacterium]|nr:hypothetical protein FACS1894177_06430 [Bacteroidia bacterium]
MEISNLTKEEKARLLAELEFDKQQEKNRIAEDRETFKKLKDETVRTVFRHLEKLSEDISTLKGIVFSRFDTIIEMKDDLFKTKSDRNSNTFTTENGSISIKLGNRVYEGWDDTVEIGIQKVKEYLKTLARDENSANLVDAVMSLLAKDRKGNLKANKVLELEKLAKKSGDPDFIDGLNIIKDAYRPVPSCQFIEVKYKDENGREKALPLSISAFD